MMTDYEYGRYGSHAFLCSVESTLRRVYELSFISAGGLTVKISPPFDPDGPHCNTRNRVAP